MKEDIKIKPAVNIEPIATMPEMSNFPMPAQMPTGAMPTQMTNNTMPAVMPQMYHMPQMVMICCPYLMNPQCPMMQGQNMMGGVSPAMGGMNSMMGMGPQQMMNQYQYPMGGM